MKRVFVVILPCVFLVSFGAAHWQKPPTHRDVFDDAGLLEARADQLKATVVSPHLEVPIRRGTNVLWCGSFQLAWNQACKLLGEDLHFLGDEPEMVAVLNKKSFDKTDIDEASYVAVADFVRNGVHRTIRSQLKEKFAGQATPGFIPSPTLTPRPQDIVCYSYLFKNLEFKVPFERIDQPIRFDDKQLACFGVGDSYKRGHETMLPQVVILDYEDPDDFVIELRTKGEQDRFILAKLPPKETLLETVVAVQDRMAKSQPLKASAGDTLKVPKLNFDITRRYSELERLMLSSNNPKVAKDLTVTSAVQNSRFQLDEKGVRLRSESHLTFGCSAAPQPPAIHVMVFDKPFLIILKRAGAKMPYFAVWVDNPELLVHAG